MSLLAVPALGVVACMASSEVWAVVGAGVFGGLASSVLLPIINGMGKSATEVVHESQEVQQPSQQIVVKELRLTVDEVIRDAYAWCEASRILGVEIIGTFIVVFGPVFVLHRVYQHRLHGGEGKNPALTETVRGVLMSCVDEAAANVGQATGHGEPVEPPQDMPGGPVPMCPALTETVRGVLMSCVDEAAANVGEAVRWVVHENVDENDSNAVFNCDGTLSAEAQVFNLLKFMGNRRPESMRVITVLPDNRVYAWFASMPDEQ